MSSVDAESVVAYRKEPSEADLAAAGLLGLISEGKPYVFLTAELGQDEDGTYLQVNASTDIDNGEILKYVLESALARLSDALTQ